MSKQNATLFSGYFLAIFLLIYFSLKEPQKEVIIDKVDTSVYDKREDSLNGLYKLRGDTIASLHKSYDSLSKRRLINNKKIADEISIIKKFDPFSRECWNDSVLRANNVR